MCNDLLCKLDASKASGPDDVPARLLKEGAPWLAMSLACHALGKTIHLVIESGSSP